ncbi:MAG: hypothetical protein AABX39_04530 [Nanoarchaeota archaeon]
MVDPNSSVPAIEPLANFVQQFVGGIQWFVGGLFGLYMIYFVIQVYRRNQELKVLKEIREEIKHLHQVLVSMEKRRKK